MSDKLYPIPLERLLPWIMAEEKQGSIFGISKELFFVPHIDQPFRMKRYGQLLENPIGVAAGPHTQLSQNIVAAWLTGARYIELKTVQTLDEIEVVKPCIDIQDEGYNCEWSQELKLRQSFDQYLDAWILVHILRHHWGWEGDGPGVIFNMSVGYDMNGILNANVQEFLDSMVGCQSELDKKLNRIEKIYPGISQVEIPGRITNNITLSTMHGCPPDEIEKIARYLIEDRHLHTTVKLNPTLLGPEHLREIINGKLGFRNVEVPDIAFEHDLKYEQALALIRNLTATAGLSGVEFGLKLTNTLEVLNRKLIFPDSEKQAYLSGRALHPISVNLAKQLQHAFDGELDISFCAGADCYNVSDLVACGVAPVTTCSDLLKPGGYGRLAQYIANLEADFQHYKAGSIDELIINYSRQRIDLRTAIRANLSTYADKVLDLAQYQRQKPFYPSIKGQRPLDYFDCVSAPCVETCAAHQGIPDYLYHSSRGEFDLAYDVILRTNSMPAVTGYVCDHQCQNKCTRINYDRPLMIRDIKRFVSEDQAGQETNKPKPDKGRKAAVVGGGPSGITCAYFLALEGFEVTLYEHSQSLGGMVSGMIPSFRLGAESISNDLNMLERSGVLVKTGRQISSNDFDRLRKENNYIYLAVGAQSSKRLGISGEDTDGVLDPLVFLADVKTGDNLPAGSEVLIIGGGNTAMDAARTARRAVGEQGKVTIVYRRTIDQMPADWEEVAAAQAEGIAVRELLAPLKIESGGGGLVLTVQKMKLGTPDSSGRLRPVPIDSAYSSISADYIIPAVGQDVELDFMPGNKIKVDPETQQTDMPDVYAGGDAVRGADTIIGAIADGHKAARSITRAAGFEADDSFKLLKGKGDRADQPIRFATRDYGDFAEHDYSEMQTAPQKVLLTAEQARAEASRCLYCDEFCDVCVTVCPNRANLAYPTEMIDVPLPAISSDGAVSAESRFVITQPAQIVNLAELCNECGNCTTFCPTSGRPFADKPHLFLTASGFAGEEAGYLLTGHELHFKDGTNEARLWEHGNSLRYESQTISAYIDPVTFETSRIKLKNVVTDMVTLEDAFRMVVLWKGLNKLTYLKDETMSS